MGDYDIKDIYQGGTSSLNPEKGYGTPFTGYHVGAGSLGITTNPRSANIVKQVSEKLSTGVKQVELALISPELFDSIPKQHLEEVRQLSKLTGIKVSVHGPIVDSVGITQQGFNELNRESSERMVSNVLERSSELDPSGNLPVIFHSEGGLPGTEWKTLGEQREAKKMIAVNRETGEMIPLEPETKYYPAELGKEYTAEKNLEIANSSKWNNSLRQVEFNRENAERILENVHPKFNELYVLERTGNLKGYEFSQEEYEALKRIHSAAEYVEEAQLTLGTLFDRAYQLAKTDNDEDNLNKLKKLSKEYDKFLGISKKDIRSLDPRTQSHAMFGLVRGLEEINPKIFVPVEEFAVDQASKTFGNAAFKTYKKLGKKAPIVAIENPPFGSAISTGEDLRNLVVKSREKFVENAVKEGMLKSEAKREAERLIGATWDVGHINMARQGDFGEKELISETEKIAPFVKHVHLSDNFGFSHTELPMGMGNVPLKKMMEKLGKNGFEARKIIEASQWWQHFQTSPVRESLEGMGASVYAGGGGPYWNQNVGLYQGYMSGLAGSWLPNVNYETFGTGFSQLPSELGGQRPGAQGSRMSGRGME